MAEEDSDDSGAGRRRRRSGPGAKAAAKRETAASGGGSAGRSGRAGGGADSSAARPAARQPDGRAHEPLTHQSQQAALQVRFFYGHLRFHLHSFGCHPSSISVYLTVLLSFALQVLGEVMSLRSAELFCEPVPEDIEGYYEEIRHPMDLGT